MAKQALDVPAHSIRRLWQADRDAVLDYFLRLDPETRASRFMGNVSEAGVRAYAARALIAEGVMYGAFADGVIRGLGELRPMGPSVSRYTLGPHAEAAFAVERPFRRRGTRRGPVRPDRPRRAPSRRDRPARPLPVGQRTDAAAGRPSRGRAPACGRRGGWRRASRAPDTVLAVVRGDRRSLRLHPGGALFQPERGTQLTARVSPRRHRPARR